MINPRILVAIALILFACAAAFYFLRSEPEAGYPRIAGYGDVVILPEAAHQPRKGAKAVFDLKADAKPGEVNKGLERVARLLNLYAGTGHSTHDIKITLVLHGDATKSVLLDKAYASRFDAKENPNLPLIRELKKAGVELFVCGQALATKNYPAGDVTPEATVAVSAMNVLIDKQADGYALIP